MELTYTAVDTLEVALLHGVCSVTFEKVDGTLRVMRCTKDLLQIPTDKHPKGTGKHKEGVMTVWDLDKQDWRSFLRDNVKGWITE